MSQTKENNATAIETSGGSRISSFSLSNRRQPSPPSPSLSPEPVLPPGFEPAVPSSDFVSTDFPSNQKSTSFIDEDGFVKVRRRRQRSFPSSKKVSDFRRPANDIDSGSGALKVVTANQICSAIAPMPKETILFSNQVQNSTISAGGHAFNKGKAWRDVVADVVLFSSGGAEHLQSLNEDSSTERNSGRIKEKAIHDIYSEGDKDHSSSMNELVVENPKWAELTKILQSKSKKGIAKKQKSITTSTSGINLDSMVKNLS